MAITCPACGKTSQTQPTCARCGGDLSLLFEVANAAATALAQGAAALQAADWREALAWAERSWRLRRSPAAARLAFLAAGALGQTNAAITWHDRALASL